MPKPEVAIIDYGAGNLHNLLNAVESVGGAGEVIKDHSALETFTHVILPGVGAFGPASQVLHDSGFARSLHQHVKRRRWLLGVCLGFQLLFSRSEEDGEWGGLDLLEGNVLSLQRLRTSNSVKIPRVGWADVSPPKDSRMYRSDEVSSAYYFVHSYFVAPNQNYSRVGATIFDSTPYCASIEHETIWGTQFHPELSGPDGLALLQRFLEQP